MARGDERREGMAANGAGSPQKQHLHITTLSHRALVGVTYRRHWDTRYAPICARAPVAMTADMCAVIERPPLRPALSRALRVVGGGRHPQ
jgi:hypothetical protein